MKTFYYTETDKRTKYGSRIVTQRVYKMEKGIPCLLVEHEYSTASCMGDISEAFKALVNIGVLPIKYQHKYAYDIPHKMYKM